MKVAICLRGAIAKTTKRFTNPGELYNHGKYVNFIAVFNSIKEHIIDVNKEYSFDFFIQSWNQDLEKDLNELYKPKATLFEDNNLYKNEIIKNLYNTRQPASEYGNVSHYLAISKSIKLMKEYSLENDIVYDYIILYRPDVLLFKDMDLKLYDKEKIYVNAHPDCGGDFHFVMNLKNSFLFSELYETTKTINEVTNYNLHGKINVFVEKYLKMKLYMDDIVPGMNQEVLRHLKYTSIDRHGLQYDMFFKYGLTKDEINSYNIT